MSKNVYINYCKLVRFLGASGAFALGGYNVANGGNVIVNALVSGAAVAAIYICSTCNKYE